MQTPKFLPTGWVVYLIVNKINSMAYVGMSGNLASRIRSHLSKVNKGGSYIHAAMRKHGVEQFELTVLGEYASSSEALDAERSYVELLETQTFGYNLTSGGDGVANLSPEASARLRSSLSKALRGKPKTAAHRLSMSVCRIGVKRPASVGEAMRDYRRGRKASEQARQKMRDARRGRAAHPNTLAALRESRRRWKPTLEQRQAMSNAARRVRGRPVQCVETSKIFETILDACQWVKELGFLTASPSPIGRVCRGKQKTAYGMNWRYSNSAEDGVAYAGLKAEAKAKE